MIDQWSLVFRELLLEPALEFLQGLKWTEVLTFSLLLLAALVIWSWFDYASVPTLKVSLTELESEDRHANTARKYTGTGISEKDGKIICYDPATRDIIKEKPMMTKEEVEEKVT